MSFIIAIDPDQRVLKDITEEWAETARSNNLKILAFDNIDSFKKEWAKPDYEKEKIELIMLPAELLGVKPIDLVNEIKTKYNCEILVSIFDHIKYTKGIETWPAQNFIFKPFDKTILREHTRFALLKNQKVKTIYVHTTTGKAEIESLTKFKILQMTEVGFRLNKTQDLTIGQVYKFYHPMFLNQKQQHMWARVVSSNETSVELVYAQMSPPLLTSIRKKIMASSAKVKGAVWNGRTSSIHTRLIVCIDIAEEGKNTEVQDLLHRNFDLVDFVDKKNLKPAARNHVDVLITDKVYDRRQMEAQFYPNLTMIHLITKPAKNRAEIEGRFSLETIRMEKPIDKAMLTKIFKVLFPMLKEKDPSPLVTINLDEPIQLSVMMEVEEYSEAAMTFKQFNQIPRDTLLDITLSQDDETLMKEMKAKVHYVNDRADSAKMYEHQVVLFGMKDEFLKLIRLWTLQRHIQKNQAQG